MELFISWSGDLSHNVARVLREYLPQIIQSIVPFVSSEDIEKGARWSEEIAGHLDMSNQGLIVVTHENLDRPWLNFEAGALAKKHSTARVRTLLVDLGTSDVVGPMAAFQTTRLRNTGDFYKLVESLNSAAATPLPEGRLKVAFDRVWPELDEKIAGCIATVRPMEEVHARDSADVLEEILERVRTIERAVDLTRAERAEKKSSTTLFDDLFGPSDVQRSESATSYAAGESIRHPDFGLGKILGVEGDGEQSLVRVEFPSGMKRLLVRYAPIVKVHPAVPDWAQPPPPTPGWGQAGSPRGEAPKTFGGAVAQEEVEKGS